jgi:integrase
MARGERVMPNIYRRTDAKGRERFEIAYRDSAGIQRWKTMPPDTTATAARGERDRILGQREAATKGLGQPVIPPVKLRFGEVADKWLAEQVAELRPATQAAYSNDVRVHLRPRWRRRLLDSITVEDCAQLVRELRAEGKAEWTVSGVLKVASRCFRFAARRMSWLGKNPVALLEKGERPKTGATARRRIYQGDELGQMLAAANEPWRTLFALAAVSGVRLSELLGVTWADVRLADPEDATILIVAQVDRQGIRQPLKTPEAERTIELPRSLVSMILEHKARSSYKAEAAFVFCSCTGRALGQRNTLRALRASQLRARTPDGIPTFPLLFEPEPDEDGRWLPRKTVPRNSVPSFHGFRHSAASEAIAAGDSAEEISWQLGHKNSVVTRGVYVQELKTAERRARRRDQMERRYGSVLEAAGGDSGQQPPGSPDGEVVDLQQVRHKAQ